MFRLTRASSIRLSVPGLASAAHWKLWVQLSFSGLNVSVFDIRVSGDWRISSRGKEELMKSRIERI